MRLFVAVHPPAEAVEHLAGAVAAVRAAHPAAAVRWVPPERWHLTLTFLCEVEERRLPDLEERLGRAAARHPVHELAFGVGGRFDRRVLWVAVDGCTKALVHLAASVSAGARRCGIPVEDRPYRPHLTLARASDRSGTDLRPLSDALSDYDGPVWTAERIALVRSTLGAAPRYDDLAAWPLAGSR